MAMNSRPNNMMKKIATATVIESIGKDFDKMKNICALPGIKKKKRAKEWGGGG
jgi:hypothetical protein